MSVKLLLAAYMLAAFLQHLFSSAEAKMLDTVRTMKAPILGQFRIQEKHRVWFFTRVEQIRPKIFLTFGPGPGSGMQKVPEKLSFRLLNFKTVLFLCL